MSKVEFEISEDGKWTWSTMIKLDTRELLSYINFDESHLDKVNVDELVEIILSYTGNLKETKKRWYSGVFSDEDVADYYWEQFINMILE